MRLKSAALFAVGFLFVSFWLDGGARCQSSLGPPLSLAPPPSATAKGSPPPPTMAPEVPMYPPPVIFAPPPSVTDQGSPPAATCQKDWGGLNLCSNLASPGVLSPRPTAKGSPPPATKNVSPPMATDDVPPRTATAKGSARSAAAKNSPPPANAKDAPAAAIDNILPTPGIGKLSPSREPAADYDGFTVGIDDGEETGQPLPIRPRPTKRSKVRQKPDITEAAIQSLGDQAEVEKLKPNLTICRGC
jgi:hypothetical protein